MLKLRLRGVRALDKENRVAGTDHAVVNRLVSCRGQMKIPVLYRIFWL